MNVCTLQEELIREPKHIATILEKLGHEGIRDRGAYYQAKNIGGDNASGCSVRKSDLVWSNFSHGKSGSIWSMIQDETGCSFKEALDKVGGWLGVDDDAIMVRPFGEMWNEVVIKSKDSILRLPNYDESLLPADNLLSYKFTKDGVSPIIQKLWGIRFDPMSDGIIIPWRDLNGDLIGAKWRNNDPNCAMDERWGMYLRFQVAQGVYGWFENHDEIFTKSTCYIFEAEKSVLQAYTMGYRNGLAIGGHNISGVQAKYINALMCHKIIICFDGGLSEEEIEYNARKLKKECRMLNTEIGYVYDKEQALLKGKDSPTDRGLVRFRNILAKCVKYI